MWHAPIIGSALWQLTGTIVLLKMPLAGAVRRSERRKDSSFLPYKYGIEGYTCSNWNAFMLMSKMSSIFVKIVKIYDTILVYINEHQLLYQIFRQQLFLIVAQTTPSNDLSSCHSAVLIIFLHGSMCMFQYIYASAKWHHHIQSSFVCVSSLSK